MYEYIAKVKLNYDYYSGMDCYSDGEIEDELLEIVQQFDEKNYNKIIGERKKWAITYHLSHIRQNIIEWYPFNKEDKVLEIGAGCGAVTGAIARKAGNVTCVELSKKRSLINAYRNQQQENLEIIVGNFQEIEQELSRDYDYITLIGVLEYASSYIFADNPYVRFIEIIKKHLKPGGKLIVAIENKYGLKYWAGCKEDHVSRYFEGIEGYRNTKSVKTFSRNGLKKLARECDLKQLEFYYPYPDYKFPFAIYSENYLPNVGELTNNMMNLDNDRIVSFDESKVYDSLIEDGMFEEFANSYLLIMEKEA